MFRYLRWIYNDRMFEFTYSPLRGMGEVYVDGKLVSSVRMGLFGLTNRFRVGKRKYSVNYKWFSGFALKESVNFVANGRFVFKNESTVNKRAPFVNSDKKSGIKHLENYDMDDALASFEKALENDPMDGEIHYWLGCCYSLLEDRDKALYHILYFVNRDAKNIEKVQESERLAYLRMQPEYQQILASAR